MKQINLNKQINKLTQQIENKLIESQITDFLSNKIITSKKTENKIHNFISFFKVNIIDNQGIFWTILTLFFTFYSNAISSIIASTNPIILTIMFFMVTYVVIVLKYSDEYNERIEE